MKLKPGHIYTCSYANWHNDQFPLLFVLYSDHKYTIGLNLHYIKLSEYQELYRMFKEFQKNRNTNLLMNDPRGFYYNWLKPKFYDFIEVAYRMYHTNLIMGMLAHKVALTRIGYRWQERLNKRHPNYYQIKDDLKNRLQYDTHLYKIQNNVTRYRQRENSPTLQTVNDIVKNLKR